MFNIGFGEIAVIVVLSLLVFGPDRLPDAARRAATTIRQLRELAASARQQVSDAAGIDDQETRRVVDDLRELNPRRIASSVLTPTPAPATPQPERGTAEPVGLDPDVV